MYSILICTTGNGDLERIIDSYLQTKYIAYEIVIVVDNPNADRERFELLAQRSPSIRIHYNPQNLGLTKSLNVGLDIASGDYVVRNDDDDIPTPTRLEIVDQHFASTDCDIAYSFATGRSESGKGTWRIEGPLSHEEIVKGLRKRNFIVASTVAYKRRQVMEVGGYNEHFRYAQDYELYLRSVRAGLRFACIPEALVERSYSPLSITVSKRKRQALCSFAARLIDISEAGTMSDAAWAVVKYSLVLSTPNSVRRLRRSIGRGK